MPLPPPLENVIKGAGSKFPERKHSGRFRLHHASSNRQLQHEAVTTLLGFSRVSLGPLPSAQVRIPGQHPTSCRAGTHRGCFSSGSTDCKPSPKTPPQQGTDSPAAVETSGSCPPPLRSCPAPSVGAQVVTARGPVGVSTGGRGGCGRGFSVFLVGVVVWLGLLSVPPPRLQGQRIHSSHSPFARVSQQCRAPPVRFWAQRLGPQSGRPTPSVETPPSPWEASLLWKEPMR